MSKRTALSIDSFIRDIRLELETENPSILWMYDIYAVDARFGWLWFREELAKLRLTAKK